MANPPSQSQSHSLPLLILMLLLSATAFQPTPHRIINRHHLQASSTDDEVSKLKQSAERLRAEALLVQEQLAGRRRGVDDVKAVEIVEYDEVADSCWEVSYRFADEPISKNEQKPRTFYTGKITLHFKTDGYTDIIDVQQQSTNEKSKTQNSDQSSTTNNTAVQFQKVWGWDIETSTQDSLDYLLFSADVQLPPLPSGVIPMPERYYFQIRVDKEANSSSAKKKNNNNNDKIVLQDGSVTVKRNVETGGWWGLFQADGILAQFREVGLFRCRPVAKTKL